jgi:hypothetical protein
VPEADALEDLAREATLALIVQAANGAIIAWRYGGTTDLGNHTLLCGPHHREFQRNGWTCQMIDGLPWWVPPKWLDPDQKPRQSTRITRGT